MASSKREELVDTARRLFYENGIHATGIDRILAEAGVSKMTLAATTRKPATSS
jgi:AcrR family transcriptional regulator